jgi:hypothetical protein
MTIRQNSIVEENELNEIYQKMIEKSQGTKESRSDSRLDPYDIYIKECKLNEGEKVDSKGQRLEGVEKHHIIPRFAGGTDVSENLVLLTVKEHVIAHWIRWKVKQQTGDYLAFLFRIGDTEEAVRQRAQFVREARERDRVNQQGFFDVEFQKEMGERGGVIGGSKNTEAQFLARQQVGLTYGRQTGVGNQKTTLRDFVKKYSIWAYCANSARRERTGTPLELYCLISPKEAFVDVSRELEKFVPGAINRIESMYKLVKGERPQMYGWKIVTTLTRSEVREGVQNFIETNPTVILQFEEDFMLAEGLE